VLGIGALVLALVAAGGGYLWYRSVSNDIDRTDPFAGITGDRPAKPVEGAMNILMLGSDSRDPDNKAKAGEWRTDTMLIAHIPANHEKAYLISIPRDLYVYIPKSPTNPTSATARRRSTRRSRGAACR
jgi:anionic cell wall polymer biosynthesis LytR-Cps2A-Psr (LCP) family protein